MWPMPQLRVRKGRLKGKVNFDLVIREYGPECHRQNNEMIARDSLRALLRELPPRSERELPATRIRLLQQTSPRKSWVRVSIPIPISTPGAEYLFRIIFPSMEKGSGADTPARWLEIGIGIETLTQGFRGDVCCSSRILVAGGLISAALLAVPGASA